MPPVPADQRPLGPRAILRPPQAAAYVGLTVSTLAKRRLYGERPHFVRLGRKAIGYSITELDAWLAECGRKSTSDVSAIPP